MERKVEQKNVVAATRELFKIEDGKLFIESEELAKALQDGSVNLFLDEEAGAMIEDAGGDNGCFGTCW